jgi:hypothetical protein
VALIVPLKVSSLYTTGHNKWKVERASSNLKRTRITYAVSEECYVNIFVTITKYYLHTEDLSIHNAVKSKSL